VDPTLAQRYRSPEGALGYRHKYERGLLRRLSNRRELALVARALSRAGGGDVLDCPCGAGRLLPVLARGARRLTAADFSATMVEQARHAVRDDPRLSAVRFGLGSAGRLPFADGSFDVAVCHRLVHHLPAAERAAVLSELARVARHAVVLSFADAATPRARARARRGRGSSAVALTAAELRAEAGRCGLVLEEPVLRIGGWVSVQAIAVLRKEA